MILLNNSSLFPLTLKAYNRSDEVEEFIIKENQRTTLLTHKKIIYIYFSKNNITPYDLKTALDKFLLTNRYDINIDIKSFNLDEEKAIKIVADRVLYHTHKQILYKTVISRPKLGNCNIITKNDHAKKIIDQAKIVYKYKNIARDLQDMPPNKLTPEIFAEKIQGLASKIANLDVTILDQNEIKKHKMGLLLAVNAGSAKEARVVVLNYRGSKSKEKLALVGKGITFDTGGISLKPSAFMSGMKYDMSGAAAACATVLSAASLKLPKNVCAVACLTENMIGSSATIVESIVTSMNGKTVEITNTDAEGRLAVSDGITYAIRKQSASHIIELSTLTGAILVALGDYMTGVFANDDAFYNCLKEASNKSFEEIWRMPIHSRNVANMHGSRMADLDNAAKTRLGGSSNGAAFIQEFVEDKPFIHLDIAGSATTKVGGSDTGTGIMITTLVELLK